MTSTESWQKADQLVASGQVILEQRQLSQSAQDLFQPLQRSERRERLSQELDFSLTDNLYKSDVNIPENFAPKKSIEYENTPALRIPLVVDTADLIAQGFQFPNPKEIFKTEFEHRYRGKEQATMNSEIPKEKWDEAYNAFPSLKQLGAKDATRLMKAIIANELDHYGGEDITQDAIAKTGHGGSLHGQSIGFGQITPDGVRDMARQFDKAVENHLLTFNPLARFEKMNDDRLAQELAKPANALLFVAAHLALDLQTLSHHSSEVRVTPEALGYFYNADMTYAKSDKHHLHLLTKKEAKAKHIAYDLALPTVTVLQNSEHAANIRKWLEKEL